MKLASYIHDESPSFGIVTQAGVIDVPSAWPDGPESLAEALDGDGPGPDRLRELAETADPTFSAGAVRLTAPIPRPAKLIGLAVNYHAHHREFDRGYDLPEDARQTTTPRPFLMPPTGVAGPGETIPWPEYSRDVDYEIELAVVIGRRASHIGPEESPDAIAGYTIANDISARRCTHAESRMVRPKDEFFDWLHGKWADGFCPLGPVLVTADEIADPMDLDLELTVNGKTRQKANTGLMIFDVFHLVSFCSRLMTLEPGDVMATGTPSGVGAATGEMLRPGDTVTCRIEGIGELSNTLGSYPDAFYTPCSI